MTDCILIKLLLKLCQPFINDPLNDLIVPRLLMTETLVIDCRFSCKVIAFVLTFDSGVCTLHVKPLLFE